ncbi:MAG: hypothetical protein ACXVLT_03460, partial [Flavisolibacter sp.]
LVVGLLNLKRYHWVTAISVIVFSLAMQMAIERWPWKGKKERQLALKSQTLIQPNQPNLPNRPNQHIQLKQPINPINIVN